MTSTLSQPRPSRYKELDGLRGIAALGVVLYHVVTLSQDLVPTETKIPLDLVSLSLGVHLFFMISGFVIFFTIRRSRSVTDFVISRFTRLYPSFWAALCITTAVGLFSPLPWLRATPTQFLGNLTMVPALFGVRLLDGVYWTLYVEMFFYFLMAVLLGLGAIRRERLVTTLATVWAAGSAALAIIYAWLGRPEGVWGKIANGLIIEFAPLFATGMLALTMRESKRFDARIVVTVISIFVAATFMSGPVLALKLTVPVGLFLWVTAQPSVPVLRSKPLQFLGGVSYTWYLLHQNISYAIIDWIPNRYVAMVVALALTLGLAWGLHETVENKLSPKLRRMLRQRFVLT